MKITAEKKQVLSDNDESSDPSLFETAFGWGQRLSPSVRRYADGMNVGPASDDRYEVLENKIRDYLEEAK